MNKQQKIKETEAKLKTHIGILKGRLAKTKEASKSVKKVRRDIRVLAKAGRS